MSPKQEDYYGFLFLVWHNGFKYNVFRTKCRRRKMREEDDAAGSRSITDDGEGRVSFNHAKLGNYMEEKF